MHTLTPDTRLAARADVLSCDVGDSGAVLLDPRAGTYLGVEGVAAHLWQALTRGAVSLADLCRIVEEEYDVSAEGCASDVRGFVGELLRRELVSVVPAPGGGGHEA